jgi:carboxymethylenebutenolidase
MGGGFVLMLAAQQGPKVSAAVPFYGVGPGVPNSFTGLTAAVQGHYAEQDPMFPVAEARKQEQQIRDESGAPVEFFYYDASHAFHNDEDLIGTYDPDAARDAWERAIPFLKANVR